MIDEFEREEPTVHRSVSPKMLKRLRRESNGPSWWERMATGRVARPPIEDCLMAAASVAFGIALGLGCGYWFWGMR